MTDRLRVRITCKVEVARAIDEVFDFIRSPANPELEGLGLSGPLSPGASAEAGSEPSPEWERWGMSLMEYSPPRRLMWRAEFEYADAAGTCTYELTAGPSGTTVMQRYDWPLPPLIYLPALPYVWWSTWAGMRRRLRKAKSLLEST